MSKSCLFLHYITFLPLSGHIDLVDGFRKEKLTFAVIKSSLRFDGRVVWILREATTKQGVYKPLPGYNRQLFIKLGVVPSWPDFTVIYQQTATPQINLWGKTSFMRWKHTWLILLIVSFRDSCMNAMCVDFWEYTCNELPLFSRSIPEMVFKLG